MDNECKSHMQSTGFPEHLSQFAAKPRDSKIVLHTKAIFDYIAWQEFVHCRQSAATACGASVNQQETAAQA
jgi:predicted transcriptional regulator